MLNLLLIKRTNNKPITNRCKLLHKHSYTESSREMQREGETERERARTKKLTRQTTKLVKKLLGSQNGKINCAHVFLFFSQLYLQLCLVVVVVFILFFMFSPLVICVFAASFNCCLLYTSLSLFHVSDFIAICNFRRDALLLLL